MKSRPEPLPALPTSKCKRIVRPLISKLHSLSGLYTRHPGKFRFDLESFQASGTSALDFANPDSARDRLRQLKPFLSAEVYESYLELFNIFRSIVASLYPEQSKTRDKVGSKRDGAGASGLPRLSSLAAQKLGKSIALGTKTSYFSLSQTILFDPTSIPRYLQKYHDTLADDIDDWLVMEPAAIFASYRPTLVLGYVIHILVLNSAELLFMLVPVLVHWLHEENLPWSRGLFMEFWLSSKRDPDHVETHELKLTHASEPPLDAFWFLHRVGYWRSMVELVRVSSSVSSSNNFLCYESLLLDVMGLTDRMDLDHVAADEVYGLLVRNPQYPCNTTILISVVAQLITVTRETYASLRSATNALDLLNATYRHVRHLVHTWLGLRDECVFNSLDRGNEDLFQAILSLVNFAARKSYDIAAHYRRTSASLCDKFERLSSRLRYLDRTTQMLHAFFMDEDISMSPEPCMAKYLFDFVEPSHDESMLITFMNWLHGQVSDTFFNEFYDIVAYRA